jgi:hypothetical protein
LSTGCGGGADVGAVIEPGVGVAGGGVVAGVAVLLAAGIALGAGGSVPVADGNAGELVGDGSDGRAVGVVRGVALGVMA